MDHSKLKRKTVSGVAWSMAERVLAQGISFIVSIVLARILLPEEYGIIALVMVIINVCNVFFSVGIPTALVQKENIEEEDYSTGFWFSLLMAMVLYTVIFFGAPVIAAFYQYSSLTEVIRVMSLSLFVSTVRSIQKAYLTRKMEFRKFFWATLGGTIAAAIVGIWMAYSGCGVWALVAQYLVNNVIDSLVLWMTIRWRPRRVFSMDRLKGLMSFGWKVLAASLLYTIYDDLRTLIIGKVYASAQLAYYNKGKQLPGFVVNNINSSISAALLPAMARLQNDPEAMRNAIRRFVRTGSYILMPMMFGMAVVAEPMVRLLLTEKWLFCVPFLQLMCIHYALQPLQEANTQAVLAAGRSDIALKAEIVKRMVNVLIILCTFRINVKVLAIGEVVASVISLVINTVVSKKLFRYGTIDQMKDLLPYISMSAVMAGICWGISILVSNVYLCLFLQISTGVLVYVGLSVVFREESFRYIWNMIKGRKS